MHHVCFQTKRLTCSEYGNFTGSVPSCTRVHCGIGEKIAHSDLVVKGTSYGDTMTYVCLPGYDLFGIADRTCTASGRWSGSKPKCILIRCLPPQRLDDGVIRSMSGYDYGATIVYTCHDSYTLVGNATRQCQGNKTWSGEPPTCVIAQCPVPDIKYAFIVWSSGDNDIEDHVVEIDMFVAGMTIQLDCEEGYGLVGMAEVACQANGSWSHKLPTCRRMVCPQPEIEHAVVNAANGLFYGMRIIITCEEGFALVGKGSMYCGEERSWSEELPECRPVKCSRPRIANGAMTVMQSEYETDEYTYKTVILLSCNDGYQLVGTNQLACLATTQWSAPMPTCQRHNCSSPPLPDHSALKVLDSRTVFEEGNIVRLGCNTGYTIVGETKLTCRGSDWKGVYPTCKKITCPTPKIRHGYVSTDLTVYASRFEYGTTAHFKCNRGYLIEGTLEAVCNANRKFSEPFPRCVMVRCPALEFLNGQIITREDIVENTYGTRLSFKCNDGYELDEKSSSTIRCRDTGKWSGVTPVCQSVSCSEPDIQHSTLMPLKKALTTAYSLGDQIEIMCDNGYDLWGSTDLTCLSKGIWSHSLPTCKPIHCAGVKLDNGFQKVAGKIVSPSQVFSYKDNVTFSCMEGYTLVGLPWLICDANKQWSNVVPKCKRVHCAALQIANATFSGTARDFSAKVAVKCNLGYELFGDSQLTCEQNGIWSGVMPSCMLTKCPSPKIAHGSFVGSSRYPVGFTFGDSIRFKCEPGYELVGEPEVLCLTARLWSSELPSCRKIVCPLLHVSANTNVTILNPPEEDVTATRNYTFGTRLHFSCAIGFMLKGNFEIECGPDKDWLPHWPICEVVTCPDPLLENGLIEGKPQPGNQGKYAFGDSLRFVCKPGFKLVGETELFCEPEGVWTGDFATCLRNMCPAPKAPENGRVVGDAYNFEDKVQHLCNQGYELNGISSVQCLANLTWSDQPSCSPVRCPLPNAIANGEYMVGGFTFNKIIRYACVGGYTLVGEADHTCLSNRTWSGDLPSCERISCGDIPSTMNGLFVGTSFRLGDKLKATCNAGYKLKYGARNTIECQNSGKWTTVTSPCRPVVCPAPETLNGGNIVGNNYTFGATIRYVCIAGYELGGNETRTCLDNQTWSGSKPRCVIVECRKPATVTHGYVEGSEYKAGDSVTYRCTTGYALKGDATRKCHSDRTWSGDAPVCELVTCPSLSTVPHGRVTTTSRNYNSIAQYACDPGYEIHGNQFRRCMATTSWEDEPPTCEKISCPQPPAIQNGFIEGTRYLFGDLVVYKCNRGYDVLGDPDRVCNADHTWSGSNPYCRLKKCPEPPSFTHGQMQGDDFTIGSTVTVQCDQGYRLHGEASIKCDDGERWSREFPQCDRISCGVPTVTENGIIEGSSFKYQDTVTIVCKPGYRRDGDGAIICKETGEWTETRMKCTPGSCGPAPTVAHAYVNGNNLSLGGLVFYSCKSGYRLNGNNLLECASTLKWKGDLPTCDMISCGIVPVIPHASTIVTLTTLGSQASYKCNHGYVLRGSAVVECVANRTWMYTKKPECVPIDCGPPPAIPNSGVKAPATVLASVATYFCTEGYRMHGKPTVTCRTDGNWTDAAIDCKLVQCPTPHAPNHGATSGVDFRFDNQVLYSCDKGYQLVGEVERKCLSTGAWSGTEPRCDRK